MKRTTGLLLGGLLALAAGCETAVGKDGKALTEIVTEPPGALVRIEGFGECESPCIVEHDAPRAVTVAKAGFKKREIEIRPGQKRIVLTLELVAPTTGVNADPLPDL